MEKSVALPEGIHATYSGTVLSVTGPQGSIERKIYHPRLLVVCHNNSIVVRAAAAKPKKSDKMFMGTFISHLKNCVAGVQELFVYEVKICSGHFPMSVSIEGNTIVVKNFLGEKVARRSHVYDSVSVSLQGDILTFSGIDKESVGQSAANLELATRITRRDRRVFQDGCYIIRKAGKVL